MKPVKIAKNVWWLLNRSESLLELNVYLLSYPSAKRGWDHLLLDPGPDLLLKPLKRAVQSIIGGGLEKITGILINHQDPDVCPNAAVIQGLNPGVQIVASEDTWRLIRFYGLHEQCFKAVESFKTGRVNMPGGQQLEFVPSPFCHFRGAMMVYDVSSRILFSGDLFGGLSFSQDLYATEESWEGIKAFHQLYMPSKEAVQLAVSKIRNLSPAPLMIAPQHGSIITGDLVQEFLYRMYNLDVGLDLLKHRELSDNYLGLANQILDEVQQAHLIASAEEVLGSWDREGSFSKIFDLTEGRIKNFKTDPIHALKTLLRLLREKVGTENEEQINLVAIKALNERNIPVYELFTPEGEMLPDYFE
ncbi:MAG: MBL fold hydrolase [Proteobacteria bacterium]|nr:MBL fold hydrolase [Pseudomonadota bacterium]